MTDYDLVPQEGYMQPDKYRVRYRCNLCATEYSRIVKSLNAKDPPCPNKQCEEARIEREVQRRLANMTQIVETREAPGVIGDKPVVRAVDATAQIVMEDYGMTDLKSGIREGESLVPSLGGAQQQQADQVFAAPKAKTKYQKQMEALGRRAIGGAFRDMAVAPDQVMRGSPPPPRIVARHDG